MINLAAKKCILAGPHNTGPMPKLVRSNCTILKCLPGGSFKPKPVLIFSGRETQLLSPVAWASFSFSLPPCRAQTNLYVAADGSAPFKSVQAAIMSVPSGSRDNPVVIHIAPGTYQELLYVQREKSFFRLVGTDPTNTILTFNLYAGITNAEGRPIGTFKTPSTTIDADDFYAENLTFANAAGPVGQALAIRVDGDRASFRNCHFVGWQDTILLNRGRQYFENCYIEGHVDFIFGAATAWFEKCEIHALRDGYLTAASTPVNVPFGFIFSHCAISAAPDVKTFLGRPWRIYASTIYLNCDYLSSAVPDRKDGSIGKSRKPM